MAENKKQLIKEAVINYIETQKPYLNPEFSMSMLSEKTGFPKHQITEVLNTEIGKNFFKLINEYRIIEVKEQLKQNSGNFSIEGIGYDCGFNSKSSFFTVFKNFTGLTPQQYRDRMENNQ